MTNDSCITIIKHLNRIQGQIDALKGYLETERPCEDVAHLTRSILTSFASVRASIIEETLTKELQRRKLQPKEIERLHSVLTLYKS
ncbi:MAG: metal-sensing transcriptional repressor [Candidatus Peribacteraceae bacterium]|nr:metal-sensing transcriptional repressor [Candidatus Peribacteraceae bacterium]